MMKVFGVLFLFLISKQSFGKSDPSLNFKTKSSEHFEIVYNAKQGELAELYLLSAEQAFIALKKYFPKHPEKTIIVLDSSTDLANGSASVFPYPVMQLYTALPNYTMSISDYSDWIYELVLHEYVHILSLYPQEGVFQYLGYLFGSIASPNILLPRWHLEGIAVAVETKESLGGRLHSDYYRSYARAIELDQKWNDYPLSQINAVQIPNWPYGDRPYYFGSLFWSEFLKDNKYELTKDFFYTSARKIPYTNSASMEKVSSKKEEDIFANAKSRFSQLAKEDLKQIGPIEEGQIWLASEENQQISPRVCEANKQIAYVDISPHKDPEIILEPGSLKIASGKSFQSIDWSPDCEKLIYTLAKTQNRYYFVYDVYEYDLASKKTKNLSTGQRIREAYYSRETQEIVAIQNFEDKDQLVILRPNSPNWEVIKSFPYAYRLQNPQFKNNESLLFLLKDPSGQQKLYELNLQTKEQSPVLAYLNQIQYLYNSKTNTYIISQHTGRSKIYQINFAENRAIAIQDSLTKILSFSVDESQNKIYFSRLSTKSYQIHSNEKKKSSSPEKKLLEYNSIGLSTAKPNLESISITEERSYSSNKHLFPRYWFPSLTTSSQSTIYQISTSGNDPLLLQSYSLNLSYDTYTKETGFDFLYLNQSSAINWFLSSTSSSLLLRSNSNSLNLKTYSLGIQSFLYGLSNDWTFSFFASKDVTDSGVSSESYNARESVNTRVQYDGRSGLKGKQLNYTGGNLSSFSVKNYFAKEDLKSYQVARLHHELHYTKSLPKFHHLKWNLLADKRSNNTSALFPGYISAGGYLYSSALNLEHQVRGYPLYQFGAWSMLSTNLEYSFPLSYVYKKLIFNPIFLNKLYARISLDLMKMDGRYFSKETLSYQRDQWEETFSSLGAELVLDSQLGYILPVEFIFGLHYGLNKKAEGQGTFSLLLKIPFF